MILAVIFSAITQFFLDLNGDGFDDLIIASMTAGKTFYENDSSYSEEQGEVYFVFGTENNFDASFDLTSLDGNNGFTIPDKYLTLTHVY